MSERVLILGAGQLGLMLAEAGARLGLVVDRYDPERGCVLPGTSDLSVPLNTEQCRSRYRVISIERELFPEAGDARLLAAGDRCPAGMALEWLTDRQRQKQLLQRLGIATAPWQAMSSAADLEHARRRWGNIVVKARRGGYDGRGTWFPGDNGAVLPVDALCHNAIIEARIAFSRELSLVGARGHAGEMAFYPLTCNLHDDGILRLSQAPVAVPDDLRRQAETALAKLMEALDYRGVMAVEFFEYDGELLVNEVAPRVHNSGHWTQDGANQCQFELHLRALIGLPLGALVAKSCTAMVNLLGTPFDPAWLSRPGKVHWYNKTPRAGRKLGHVNLVATDTEELARQLAAWRDQLPGHWSEPLDGPGLGQPDARQ